MKAHETGPIYGAQLIELLKCGGMLQAMPSRSDLQEAQKKHTRVVAGYEVLLFKYHRLIEALEFISGFDSLDDLIQSVISNALDECERKDETDSLGRPEPFDDEEPFEIRTLAGRCEVGQTKFTNEDMSESLHFGQTLWRRLCRMAEYYEKQSGNFMQSDSRARIMELAAKDMRHVLEDTRKDCRL